MQRFWLLFVAVRCGGMCSAASVLYALGSKARIVPVYVTVILISLLFSAVQAEPAKKSPRFETFSGTDVTTGSVFGYFGGVWALGRDVRDAGFRLKALGGWGQYDYKTTLPGFPGEKTVNGIVGLLQVLGGYQWQRGEWTIKTYAGFSYEEHKLNVFDPGNSVEGPKTGGIGQVELWRNLGPSGFLSVDSSYSTAFDGYFLQGRLGKRPVQRLSLGIEGAALGNEEHNSGRGGAFLRVHLRGSDITVSGGVSSDYDGGDIGGYAGLGFFSRF